MFVYSEFSLAAVQEACWNSYVCFDLSATVRRSNHALELTIFIMTNILGCSAPLQTTLSWSFTWRFRMMRQAYAVPECSSTLN